MPSSMMLAVIDMLTSGEPTFLVENNLELSQPNMEAAIDHLYEDEMKKSKRIELEFLLNVIRCSHYVTYLTIHLIQLMKCEWESDGEFHAWQKVMKLIARSDTLEHEEWNHDTLRKLSDNYWSVVIRHFISRGDFRRAWDEIKKAYAGVVPDPPTVYSEFSIQDVMFNTKRIHQGEFGISGRDVVRYTESLYEAMVSAGTLSPTDAPMRTDTDRQIKLHQLEGAPASLWMKYPMPGVMFIRVVYSNDLSGCYATAMAMQISRHFANERNKKRKAKK